MESASCTVSFSFSWGGHSELYPSQEANRYLFKFEVPIVLADRLTLTLVLLSREWVLFAVRARPSVCLDSPTAACSCRDKDLVAFLWPLGQPVSCSETEH